MAFRKPDEPSLDYRARPYRSCSLLQAERRQLVSHLSGRLTFAGELGAAQGTDKVLDYHRVTGHRFDLKSVVIRATHDGVSGWIFGHKPSAFAKCRPKFFAQWNQRDLGLTARAHNPKVGGSPIQLCGGEFGLKVRKNSQLMCRDFCIGEPPNYIVDDVLKPHMRVMAFPCCHRDKPAQHVAIRDIDQSLVYTMRTHDRSPCGALVAREERADSAAPPIE